MRVSVKADYAVRAVVELGAAYGGGPVAAEQISEVQNIPLKFLHNILAELKQDGIVKSHRGTGGGFELARDPDHVTLGDIIRVTDGPLARVGDYRPDELAYSGHTAALRDVWVAVRVGIRDVLDEVSVAAVSRGELPEVVHHLLERPDAWLPRVKLDPHQLPRAGVPGRGMRSVGPAVAKASESGAAVVPAHRSGLS
jgi:Rrf2 family protein